MRILFASGRGGGQITPMVPFAHAYERAGHEVTFAAPGSARGLVERAFRASARSGRARRAAADQGSTRSSAICFADSSNSISKMPSIVALKEIFVVTPALTSFLMS